MGTLVVERVDELVEPGLLLKEVLTRRLGGLALERQMHPFMAAILLRPSRADPLDADPEAEPPDGELAEVEESIGRGEGDSIVRADCFRQAAFLEDPFEDAQGVLLPRGFQSFATEEVPGGGVRDGQRKAVSPASQHEPALVVGAPEVVGLHRLPQRSPLGLEATDLPTLDQAVAVQDRMNRAGRRSAESRVLSNEELPDFGRPPAGLLLLEANDGALDLGRQLVRLPIGTTAAIRQAQDPDIPITFPDLVAGLPGNPELAAQGRHLVAFRQPDHEFHPLVHGAALFPRHGVLLHAIMKVLPM